MKIIDLTGVIPIIGAKKKNWLFRCDYCGYEATFILNGCDGMSTGCERCYRGDMERIKEVKYFKGG